MWCEFEEKRNKERFWEGWEVKSSMSVSMKRRTLFSQHPQYEKQPYLGIV